MDGRWPHPVDHSPKTRSRHWPGLAGAGRQIADLRRKLSVAEVERRISHCHAPYWAAVTRIEAAHGASGRVVHLNCHSMPAEARPVSWVKRGTRFADIVLGDDGSTCSPALTTLIADAFRSEGLSVAINDPYKGAWNWSSVLDARRTTGTASDRNQPALHERSDPRAHQRLSGAEGAADAGDSARAAFAMGCAGCRPEAGAAARADDATARSGSRRRPRWPAGQASRG